MIRFNMVHLDKLVAPDVSKFTTAQIPDLREEFPQAPHWLANHFLNNILSASFGEGTRQVVLGLIRRVHHGFIAYHQAREATLSYLEGNRPDYPKVNQYYKAVSDWETFALQSAIALDLFKTFNGGVGAFEKNDGSHLYRLYTMANRIKHFGERANSGPCLPLWLTNEGLQSLDIATTYEEAAEALRELAQVAGELEDAKAFVGRRP